MLFAASMLLLSLVSLTTAFEVNTTMNVPSPCNGHSTIDKAAVLLKLKWYAENAFDKRHEQEYSEDATLRWTGIHDRVCPANVPKYSDCSSFVTWIYWQLFGDGHDFLNGAAWGSGYTGTLWQHGTDQGTDAGNLQVGDVCIYGSSFPYDHAAFYIGGGTVISHGTESHTAANWKLGYNSFGAGLPLAGCRRYI